ncbi:MAG: histidinol-phosphatase, partial [Flavobacteriaceae bacterium]|nr:histidinol-phosphatase [Flavobacteriaceae bacterium]
MKRVLFIDRDGTLIKEPSDEQIDGFDKLEFYPKVFQYLGKIARELDFEIVMITNQDGLGTAVYPENTFWPVHHFVMQTFKNEGVEFAAQFIDRTFAKDNAPTRKPNTGLLTKYFSEDYNLENSFVIGDRLTDVELAKNLGSKGIYINDDTNLGTNEITVKRDALDEYIALECNDWEVIYKFLKTKCRT